MTEIQIFLAALAALIVLTAALGAAIAFGVRFFSKEVAEVNPTSVAPILAAAGSTGGKPAEAEPAAPDAVVSAPARSTTGIALGVFAVIIVGVGIAAGIFWNLMPFRASVEADQVDLLFSSMLGIAVTIFLLVEGLLIYSTLRFRRKPAETGDGIPLHGSSRLEIAWTVVPVIIVLWLGIYSYQILVQLQTPRPDAMIVQVTGRQFQWQFKYPESGVTTTDLHLPVNRAVRLNITSEDVIHSFWVPDFRIKQDAMPQRQTVTYFTADVVGEFQVVCAELCGTGHANMGLTSKVIVQPQADFDAWLAEQAGALPTDPRITLFTATYGCAACHTLDVAKATGQIGPNLNGIGTRAETREPGMSAADYLHQSILEPNAFIAPECPTGACPPGVMPQDFATRMSPDDLEALVSLLLEQK